MLLLLALIASSDAYAQTNFSAPQKSCTCWAGLGSPPGFGPRNFVFLIDGRRFDISTYRFFRSAMVGQPQEELPSRAEPFFDSGMYRIIPEVEIVVGPGYGYAASIAKDPAPFSEGASGGFDTEIDFIDTEAPTVGAGLRVTTRVFTNECGSQAIYFEDGGTSDDFSENTNRLPVLVRLRSLERDVSFTTFSTTYGFTNEAVENVISYFPFMGRCIGEKGLETLDFERGERVEVELTVYDYAGNAAAPVTQTIEWPIERTDPGNGGATGAGGVGSGEQSGGGGIGGSSSGDSSGCAVQTGRTRSLDLALPLLALLVLLRRKRFGCNR